MNKKTLLIIIGLSLIAFMVLIAVFAPWLTPQSPTQGELKNILLPPSSEHWFGTDNNGVDIFAQVLYGARLSLFVAFGVVTISSLIGLVVGSIAGFFGGWIDQLLMRLIDILYAFPGILLMIALVGLLQESSPISMVLALCVTGWASYARLARGEVLHLRERDYVASARALGASSFRQLVIHIWPNLVAPLIVQATFGMAGTIIVESSLSFLGLGPASYKTASWGALLRVGKNHLVEAPYICFFPGMAILILVLGFNLFGDGLRDYLDPKKSRA